MGFLDKIKNIVSVPEDDYDSEDYYGYEEDDDDISSSGVPAPSGGSYYNEGNERTTYKDSYDNYRSQRYDRAEQRAPEQRVSERPSKAERRSPQVSGSKVVNFSSAGGYQMVLVKPEGFGEATTIADHLMGGNTVVLNLESVSPNAARKLVDFLAGVTYSQNGQFKRVAASTYVITPSGVDVRGELSFTDMSEFDDIDDIKF